MSWQLAENEDIMMLDERCDKCGFLMHVVRDDETLCLPRRGDDDA